MPTTTIERNPKRHGTRGFAKQIEGTEDKARILTLLGYSQRTVGAYDKAIAFHQEALEIAIAANDYSCEVANLNHLSRTNVNLKNYSEAINYSQRALIGARQVGDKLGEANASVELRSAVAEFIYPVVTSYLDNPTELDKWIVIPSDLHVAE